MSHKTAIIYGSVRSGRLGIRVVNWLEQMLAERGHEVTLVDQKEYQLPMLDVPLHYMKPGTVPENIQRAADVLTACEGFVVVAGEYNHAIQPGLSNLLDHFYRGQFGFKPALIASYSYGHFAGVRATTQLRAHLAELGMVTVPASIAVPSIVDSLDGDAKPQNEKMVEFAAKAISEYEFYLRALSSERANGIPE